MELQAVMEKRRSIRHYNPERKVTKEQLEELIKAASYAPSWKNLQTSRYYCVLSENAVKELREKCLPEFNQANSDGAGAYIVTTFVKGMVGFDKNTGSPVNEAGDGWGYYDLGLQNENLLLKAAELGLDRVPERAGCQEGGLALQGSGASSYSVHLHEPEQEDRWHTHRTVYRCTDRRTLRIADEGHIADGQNH